MNSWREINLFGARTISKIVNVFEVEAKGLPGERFKIKVIEQLDGKFVAMPNVCAKNSSGVPEWICGLGETSEEALEDALKWFMRSLEKFQPFKDADVEWMDSQDF